MTTKQKSNTFESSIERLESIVDQMESGDATLEQSLSWFEEGMALIKSCQSQLSDAEKKVNELVDPTVEKSSESDE